MIYTLQEVIEKLKSFDEITLLEILDISSEEILERFEDYVEDQYEKLSAQLDDQELQSEED